MPIGKPPTRSHTEPLIPIAREAGETGADVLERVAEKVLTPQIGKLTKGPATKLPRQIAAIVYMRMQGLTRTQMADKLGCKPRRITELLYIARTQYNFNDIFERVQSQAIPQAIENLNAMLDEGDREATFETLKGTGVFRKHVVGKDSGNSEKNNTLKVEISLPEGMTFDTMPVVAVGSILANPRQPPQLRLPVTETVDAVG